MGPRRRPVPAGIRDLPGSAADLDVDLLRAFEIDKELYEFAYAATYLPAWLYAPTGGMRGLFEADGR